MEKTTAEFIVVANRLPVDRQIDLDGSATWRTSPGGLVTALEPVMKARGGAWVGWHGAPDEQVAPFEHDGFLVKPVPLSTQEVQEFYEGFSNATLWPLYHDVVVLPEFHREWWHSYRAVNARFADAVAQIAAPGATVWVQDYQMQLVPKMLRELRPDLRIGFFLHIPFPPMELFVQLPWRTQIVEGMLGADLIGFQVPGAAQNYLRLARRLTGTKTAGDRVLLPDGRTVAVRAYPISIDAESFHALGQLPEVLTEAAQLRNDLGNPKKVFLGVDRLDYTKGIRSRIKAFGELFLSGELNPDDYVFLQIATPTREKVEEYRKLRNDIDQMVGRINSEVGRIGDPVMIYRHQSFTRQQLAAMYQMADVMVVTPLRDGMNLVAKEYIACHSADDGALVLSEFAGAARELKQAYLVNPYDTDSFKRALVQAATEVGRKRRSRMRALRKQVFSNTIDLWASNFLGDLHSSGGGIR